MVCCQWILFTLTCLLSGYSTMTTSVNLNPDPSGCECVRAQEMFDILQTIVTRSQIKYLTVISDTNTKGCANLGDLQGVLSIISCSDWKSLSRSQAYHKSTLSTIIINCDVNITKSVIREVLTARRSRGVERRLLLPVYNFIMTQHIEPINTTDHLDFAAIHFVSITRTYYKVLMNKNPLLSEQPCQSYSKLMCPPSKYEIKTRAGEQAWRVVGRYRNTYTGDPSFLRNKFVHFEGMHLIVIHELYRPFTMISNGTYYGYCIELLEAIAWQLNFTYDLIYSVDGKFGVKLSNGRWNGMVGMMERKEGDMIMAGLTITGHRETVVDFSIPFFEEPSAIVVKAKPDEISWSLLFAPLQLYVWVATAASLVISILLINLLERSATLSKNDSKSKEKRHIGGGQDLQSLRASTWLMISLYTRQAAVKLPSAGLVRLCLGLIWLLPLIVGWVHGANLTASLATVKKTPPFNTLEELANDTEYTIQVGAGGVHRLLFESAKSGVYAALWAKISNTLHASLTTSSRMGLARMFNDSEDKKYAVVSDHTSLITKLALDYGDRCDWAFIPELFFTSGFGLALPEGSPYKDIFDRAILAVLSSGLTVKFKRRSFPKPPCEDNKQGTQTASKSISLSHVKTIFALVFAGITIATFVLLLENSFKRPPKMGQKGQPQNMNSRFVCLV